MEPRVYVALGVVSALFLGAGAVSFWLEDVPRTVWAFLLGAISGVFWLWAAVCTLTDPDNRFKQALLNMIAAGATVAVAVCGLPPLVHH